MGSTWTGLHERGSPPQHETIQRLPGNHHEGGERGKRTPGEGRTERAKCPADATQQHGGWPWVGELPRAAVDQKLITTRLVCLINR